MSSFVLPPLLTPQLLVSLLPFSKFPEEKASP